jgi:hypothetical protein
MVRCALVTSNGQAATESRNYADTEANSALQMWLRDLALALRQSLFIGAHDGTIPEYDRVDGTVVASVFATLPLAANFSDIISRVSLAALGPPAASLARRSAITHCAQIPPSRCRLTVSTARTS